MNKKNYLSNLFDSALSSDGVCKYVDKSGINVVFKGVKITKSNKGDILLKSTETDFYIDIDDCEHDIKTKDHFKSFALRYSLDRCYKTINMISKLIANEMESRRNYKKIIFYKGLRKYYLTKITNINASIREIKEKEC